MGFALAAACWLLYFAVNLGRLNLSAVISAMAQSEQIPKDALGLMVSLFFISYGGGQLFCGIIAERFNAVVLAGIGAAFACIANLVTASTNSIFVMEVSWMINGAGQSLIWIPMARLLSEYLPKQQCIRASIHISITGPAAMFAIYGLSALFLLGPGWRAVFYFSGIFIFAATLLWILIVPKIVKNGKAEPGAALSENDPIPRAEPLSRWSLRAVVSASGLGWLTVICFLQGILKDGINSWIPTYFVDNFQISPSFSALLSMALPVCNVAGVYISRITTKNISNNEIDGAGLFFMVIFFALFVLWLFPGSIIITLFLFLLVTTSVITVNTLTVTIMPFRYTRTGRMPVIIGILNTSIYIGSGTAGYLFGRAAESVNWNSIRVIWYIAALSGAILCAVLRGKWKKFSHYR